MDRNSAVVRSYLPPINRGKAQQQPVSDIAASCRAREKGLRALLFGYTSYECCELPRDGVRKEEYYDTYVCEDNRTVFGIDRCKCWEANMRSGRQSAPQPDKYEFEKSMQAFPPSGCRRTHCLALQW